MLGTPGWFINYTTWLFSILPQKIQNYITYSIFKKIIFFWKGISLFWILLGFYKFWIILEFFKNVGVAFGISPFTLLVYLIIMHIWPIINYYFVKNYIFIWSNFLHNWLKQKFNSEESIINCTIIVIYCSLIITLIFFLFFKIIWTLLIYSFLKTFYGWFFYFNCVSTFFWLITIIYYFSVIRNKKK